MAGLVKGPAIFLAQFAGDAAPFQHRHLEAGLGQIGRANQPVMAAADNHDVPHASPLSQFVIARGAKQSRALPIGIRLTALDCRVAALLAMTEL